MLTRGCNKAAAPSASPRLSLISPSSNWVSTSVLEGGSPGWIFFSCRRKAVFRFFSACSRSASICPLFLAFSGFSFSASQRRKYVSAARSRAFGYRSERGSIFSNPARASSILPCTRSAWASIMRASSASGLSGQASSAREAYFLSRSRAAVFLPSGAAANKFNAAETASEPAIGAPGLSL